MGPRHLQAFLGLALLCCGCSASSTSAYREPGKKETGGAVNEGKTAAVAGKVTYRGQPLSAGTVTFHSDSGSDVSAIIEDDGSYKAAVVPLGKYKVTVKAEPAPVKGTAFTKEKTKRSVPVPEKYSRPESSGLSAEVSEQETGLDIKLDK
jgi:ABC-type Na+ efflux pump permease subunit